MVLPLTFRIIVAVSFVLSIIFCVVMWRDSKEMKDYDHLTGKITYLDKQLGNLPNRDMGSYRYLKIENYRYPFEIYTDEQGARMDSLKTGDEVTVFFYQTGNTEQEGINRFAQFIEKNSKLYYKRGNFMITVGISMIVCLILLSVGCYFLYKKGKIPY